MKSLKNILYLTLPSLLFAFILVELIFRFIFIGGLQPYRRTDTADNTLLLRYDKSVVPEATYSLGKLANHRSKWALNNDEWNANIDYQKEKTKKRVVVIGDSFVAGIEVNQEDHFGSQLRKLFNNDIDIYTIGVGGAPLADYYKLTEYALKHYKPDLIILNVVGNDFDESIKSMIYRPYNWQVEVSADSATKFIAPETYTPDKLRRFLSYSYFVRWINTNLKADFSLNIFSPKPKIAYSQGGFDSLALAKMQKASDYILKETIALDTTCQYIIASHLPYSTNTEGGGNPLNTIISNSCQSLRLQRVDIAKQYFADVTANKKDWVFAEYQDSHWNEKGHQEVARILQGVIKEKLKL